MYGILTHLLTKPQIAHTIGGVGMWCYVVVLPQVQADFGVDRGWASVPYAASMIGFGFGNILMGRLSDRIGVFWPLVFGAVALFAGFTAASMAQNVWQIAAAQGLLIGLFGSSTVFGPLLSDISQWFSRRRGLAVGIVACGNYAAAAIWPPLIQHFVETVGWRTTYFGIGVVCVVTMLPLALMMRRRPPAPSMEPRPVAEAGPSLGWHAGRASTHGMSPNVLMALLVLAGISCCVAMAMPQVHIVALCGDLGFGPARGAEMLSLMMAMGVVSRLFSGWICDRIGGLATLLAGSILQGVALLMFLPSDGLASLYVVSALFGLFQGGIVPSYAIIVREYFPVREAGARIGIVLFATLIGMAFGGWLSGQIFDLTGTYYWAFVNGIAWNILNGSIAAYLLWRLGRPHRDRDKGKLGSGAQPAPA